MAVVDDPKTLGRARLDFAKEEDLVADFFYSDAQVADSFQAVGQIGQLVIMRGE